MKRVTIPLIVLSLCIFAPASAHAHGIGIEVKLRGNLLCVEAFFDDDTPAGDAKVTITKEGGEVIIEGKSDSTGHWSFPTPEPGQYRVVVDAGAGHLAKSTFRVPARSNSKTDLENSADTTVSEGLTRAETTGMRRLWMAGVGLTLIGALTAGFYYAKRLKSPKDVSEVSQ